MCYVVPMTADRFPVCFDNRDVVSLCGIIFSMSMRYNTLFILEAAFKCMERVP